MGLFTQNGLLRTTFFTNDGLLRLLYDPTLVVDLDLFTDTLPDGLTFSRASAATDVINGVLTSFASGVPRISVANGYLPENQATNEVQNSTRSANNAIWSSANQTGPDGVFNSSGTLTEDMTAGSVHFLVVNTMTYTASTYTFSAFFKMISGTARVQLATSSLATGAYANFSLIGAGSVLASGGGATNPIITALSNGWYRVSFNAVCAAATATASAVFLINSDTAGRAPYFDGNGTNAVAVFGMQTEAGAKVTSYIPTTTAAATRAADVCYKDMTGIANVSEGTLFVQVRDAGGSTGQYKFAAVLTGSGTNVVQLAVSSANDPHAQLYSAAVEQAGIYFDTYAGGRLKMAVGYELNNVNAASNGEIGTNVTTAAMPVVLTRLDIGNRESGIRGLNGYVEAVRYYNKRKTDAELQAMTA